MATMTVTHTIQSSRKEVSGSRIYLPYIRLIPSRDYRRLTGRTLKSESDFLMYHSEAKRKRSGHALGRKRMSTTLLSALPVELIQAVLSWLPAFEVWRLRGINRAFRTICLGHASAYRYLDLSGWLLENILFQADMYTIFPRLPQSILGYLLPSCQIFKLSHILIQQTDLLSFFTNTNFTRLHTLDLSFNLSLSEEMLLALSDNGVRFQKLILKGCKIQDGVKLEQATHHVEYLDLSWSAIKNLPTSSESKQIWSNLSYLNLSACDNLQSTSLNHFLTVSLPQSAAEIQLASLPARILSLETLYHLSVRHPDTLQPSALRSIDLSRLDQLTKQDVRLLIERWSSLRNDQSQIDIKHTALLESDDVAGWRAFISLLAHAEVVL